MNLARVLARSGLRVVLVDADPHGGGLRTYLSDMRRPGLLEHLRGDANLKTLPNPPTFLAWIILARASNGNRLKACSCGRNSQHFSGNCAKITITSSWTARRFWRRTMQPCWCPTHRPL